MVELNNKKTKEIEIELNKFYRQDNHFSEGNILGSMCTAPHPIAIRAYQRFLDTNLGDPELFPGTKKIEKQLINFISKILRAPDRANGIITSGGTEGNINAIWLAKLLSKKKKLLLPKSAHFSFEKIASLMDIKIKKIDLTSDYIMDIHSLRNAITDDVAAVVAIAGSTDLGTIDPIPEISDICKDEHIFLHVDAAFGGFIIPFLNNQKYNLPCIDFSLPGVSSISIDAHKMGYAAIPLGTLIIRNKKWQDEISVDSPCINSPKQAGLLGTRSGGPVAAAFAVSTYLGIEGYKNLAKSCIETTEYLTKHLQNIGLSLVITPVINVVAIKLKNPNNIVEKLALYGWHVNLLQHISSIRLVMMPQITKNIIDKFIPILENVCKQEGEI